MLFLKTGSTAYNPDCVLMCVQLLSRTLKQRL